MNSLLINVLKVSALTCLRTVKWFLLLLFVCTELNSFKYYYLMLII